MDYIKKRLAEEKKSVSCCITLPLWLTADELIKLT